MEKKTYVFISGKHHGTDENGEPKVYRKGDKIELTEQEAAGLANKVIDPQAAYGVTVSNDTSSLEAENSRLKERVAELEQEVEELKEAIDEDA